MSYPKIIKEAALEKMFHTGLSFTDLIRGSLDNKSLRQAPKNN
jgi:hypothetical protein